MTTPIEYVLTPAYGRDYKSKAEVLADITAGKDFMLNAMGGCCYGSLRDLPPGRYTARYRKQTMVLAFTVTLNETNEKVVTCK